MYLSNGVDINVKWTEFIAVSHDGVSWTTIRKNNFVDVQGTFSNPLPQGSQQYPINRNYGFDTHGRVQIKLTDGTRFSFEVQKVNNQPTWLAPATVKLKVDAAINDITEWLS